MTDLSSGNGPENLNAARSQILPTTPGAEWRPLLMSEYPPPGPTKLGPMMEDGTCKILVYAPRFKGTAA